MKYISRITALLILAFACLTAANGQTSTSVENLRSQLNDVDAKETELRTRLNQIDEDLKQENIEKFFALNGSTHPEELREQRRHSLEGQRANVQSQLDQLATSRTRLESAIATAEAAAYRQSGGSSSYTTNVSTQPAANGAGSVTLKPKPGTRRTRRKARTKKRG